jgi:2-oxoglutarate/2-oxoacid ferredoxin oxidoreductase subunit alpha
MERLARKFETARSYVPRPEVFLSPGAEIGIIAFGSSDFAIHESLDQLKREYRLNGSYL